MKAGALEFLTKPVNDEDLLDAIQQAIAPIGRGFRGHNTNFFLADRAAAV